ncbi:MAG: hypothetical protein IPP15_00530 [Saprospiraceae bacterium]|uniref:Uncharacterized protein n=1 Tax=Candidatus Opimibacter skivensis TaxID=2982028 RepID=A0A9D7XM89_9BACT|nr:hypothetical protein [Candidatus Opimibacter skivensis]
MKKLLPKWFAFFLLFSEVTLYAQDQSTFADVRYGLDPLLYNGKFYTYFASSETKGSPFFYMPDYAPGFVQLHGLIYTGLALNYDLVNQQLVLQYKIENGGIKHIIISDAWLEAFNLGNTHFEVVTRQDSIKHIYQLIGSGPMHILYAWSKELKLDTRPGAKSFFFSKPMRRAYLSIGKDVVKYFNNKSFVSILDAKNQNRVKKYLSQSHVNVKKAPDAVMEDVVSFLNTPLK